MLSQSRKATQSSTTASMEREDPPPYKSSPDTAEQNEEQQGSWYGQLPCLPHFENIGCQRHKPKNSPICRAISQRPPQEPTPKPKSRLLELFRRKSPGDSCCDNASETTTTIEDRTLPLFHSHLPEDPHSLKSLAPLHPTMPYHLAFYHLDCVRRTLEAKGPVAAAFIPELSCDGTGRFNRDGVEYTWSSEIYFKDGTFLQKQEIQYTISRNDCCRDMKFNQCPHLPLEIGEPWFSDDKDGSLIANCRLAYTSSSQEWNSTQGRLAEIEMCRTCHSDTEHVLELIGGKLHIRSTCYRDLGGGQDRHQSKWTSLLTGKSRSQRQLETGPDQVYGKVWRTAKELDRPGLHVVIHHDMNGKEYDPGLGWL